jgi:hypothetical protein
MLAVCLNSLKITSEEVAVVAMDRSTAGVVLAGPRYIAEQQGLTIQA